jgi:YD repeat-containing protein
MGVNGAQANQTFVVHYTDGSTQTFTQSLSDWHTPGGYPGESEAVSMAYRDKSTGTTQTLSTPFYAYGYNDVETETFYDPLNRPIETKVAPIALNLTTFYAYDAAGNKTSVTDPNGNVTLTAYDFDNRPTKVTAPEIANAADGGAMQNPITTTAYDKDGNVTIVSANAQAAPALGHGPKPGGPPGRGGR